MHKLNLEIQFRLQIKNPGISQRYRPTPNPVEFRKIQKILRKSI